MKDLFLVEQKLIPWDSLLEAMLKSHSASISFITVTRPQENSTYCSESATITVSEEVNVALFTRPLVQVATRVPDLAGISRLELDARDERRKAVVYSVIDAAPNQPYASLFRISLIKPLICAKEKSLYSIRPAQ